MGIGSDACSDFFSNQKNSDAALGAFFSANTACKANLEQDSQQFPWFYSSCSCSSLKPSHSNGVSIAGYSFSQSQGPVFTADYPTSSPYVTSVGATQLVGDAVTSLNEIGASILTGAIITTGGGFSSFQPMETYQDDAVNAYVHSGVSLPPSWSFNTSNRGYPDVSFCGHNFLIFIAKSNTCPCQAIPVDGTSASSPSFAGVISLLNDQLLNEGKSTLGFLNYLLYQMASEVPTAFNDITSGNNRCNRGACCLYGYTAAKGWDPVSGLGSPNFVQFYNYISQIKGLKTLLQF